MKHARDNIKEQCLSNIKKYEQWGTLLTGQSWIHLYNSNAPMSALTIHNGLEYIKANMKLRVLQDDSHTDKEKEHRLRQIDVDIHRLEEILMHDLEYRGLLTP
ncbi:MAG: hypothetical protein VZR53_05330 [Prevotella sp.]|nr:hypothetical protein [Prevotella sp.]